ncbi:MAG: hypothetical protein ACYS8Y_10780 [Planctomycetota bacterium]|jgi:hypothetical protein
MIMRILAIIINCFVLLSMLVVSFARPGKIGEVGFVFTLVFITINLLALVFGGYDAGWVRLYCKRRELEEMNRIDALTSNTKNEQDKDDQRQ